MTSPRSDFRFDEAGISYAVPPRQDWQAAASPLPPAPRLDSAERNAAGHTRHDMVCALLGDAADGKPDAEVRRAFCEAFAQRSGFALSFDGVPDSIIPLYFEARFEEWDGGPVEAPAPTSVRLDAGECRR